MKRIAIVIGCALLLAAVFAIAGASPSGAFDAFVKGSLGSPSAIAGTLRETTPLLLCGAAVFLALQAGLFNIGADGQFVVGALAAAVIGLKFAGPAGVALGTVAATLTGALWAAPVGWIKAYRGGHEVITAIMLNNIAAFLTTALVAGPFRDPGQQTPTTALLGPSSQLPSWGPVPSGLLIAILATVAIGWWIRRSVGGFELRAVGRSPRAALFAGVDSKAVQMRAMIVSGGIAGLAGAIQVFAFSNRFYADFSAGYGFNALGVALLAGQSPVALGPAAIFFGLLTKASASLQFAGLPKGAANVVLGCLIAISAVYRYRDARQREGE